MVDFKKILDEIANKTPEQREQERLRWEQERLERDQETIKVRQAQIANLTEKSAELDEWGKDFVSSLQHKGNAFDPISHLAGGELLYLSDKQLTQIARLSAEVEAKLAPSRKPLPEPKSKTILPASRMKF